MIIIGVTGSFGSGKSTVTRFFREKGAVIIDADKVVHQQYKPKTECWRKLKKRFDKEILNKNETINRKRLAEIVFSSRKELEALCKIIHPVVIKEIKDKLKAIKKKEEVPLVVIDAPLLFETGLEKIVDFTVCVCTPHYLQIKRILNKTSISRKEIEARLEAQMSIEKKKQKSDFIINNSSSLKQTRKEVIELLNKVKEERC